MNSIRRRLLQLILVAALPPMILAAIVAWVAYREQRQTIELHLVETSRALATSRSLQRGDLADFHDQASAALSDKDRWVTVSAVPSGRQLLNTRVPFGGVLRRQGGNRKICLYLDYATRSLPRRWHCVPTVGWSAGRDGGSMVSADDQEALRRLRSGLPVLIVDDYADMRAAIRGMLDTIGCTNVSVDDGRCALALLHERQFGLIISDLYMQPIGGLALLHEVRADKQLDHIPFIMISGGATRDTVMAAKQLDVDGYLVKPFTTAQLTRLVLDALRRHAEPSGPPADHVEPAELRAGIAVLMAVIERRLAMAELTLDEQTLELLKSYLARASELGLEPRHTDGFAALCSALRATIGTDDLRPVATTDLTGAKKGSSLPYGTTARLARRELRRHLRFTGPVLEATIGNRVYRTVDWSCDGIAILGYNGALAPDRRIEATIRAEGSEPSQAVFCDTLTVVRHDATQGRLSAKFRPGSWTGLKLVEQFIHRRIGIGQGGGVAA